VLADVLIEQGVAGMTAALLAVLVAVLVAAALSATLAKTSLGVEIGLSLPLAAAIVLAGTAVCIPVAAFVASGATPRRSPQGALPAGGRWRWCVRGERSGCLTPGLGPPLIPSPAAHEHQVQ